MGRRLVAAVALVVAGACTGDDASTAPTPTTTTTSTTTTTTTAPVAGRYQKQVFDEVSIARDVPYGAAPGLDGSSQELLLDLYQPAGDDADRRAAIVFVHGGGFRTGDKTIGVSPELAEHFARLGYVTVSANYRLLAVGRCSGSNADDGGCSNAALEGIHDGQAAVRWLRAHADEHRLDPNRIAIAGESAGGVIATGAGTWSDGPGESGTPGVSSEVQAFMSLSGSLPGCLFASSGDAPGIFFASVGDPTVPHSWSVDCRDKLSELGIAVELVSYEGPVHVPFQQHREEIIDRTVSFFYDHLDLATLST